MKLIAVEKITLAYAAFTTVLVVLFWTRMADPASLLLARAYVVAMLGALWLLYRRFPTRLTLLLRYIYPLTLLSVWYPDTFEFCQLFPNLDHVFARADQALFSCQPALTFSETLPQKWVSELLHLGYFSYYPMIFLGSLLPLFLKPPRGLASRTTLGREFERSTFIVLAGFMAYYLIYLFLPVAGPQYYFAAIGLDAVRAADFPAIGFYFQRHAEMLASPGPEGICRTLVEMMQEGGERPTAAFPSSHVGMGTILMFLIFRARRAVGYVMLPLYLFLVLATVYIQAHYVVDAAGGLISAVLLYIILNSAFNKIHPIQ